MAGDGGEKGGSRGGDGAVAFPATALTRSARGFKLRRAQEWQCSARQGRVRKGACVQAALMRTVTSVALYLIEFAANLIAKDPIFVAMVSVHLRLSCSSHRSPLAAHRKDHLWPFSLELQKPNATVGLFRVDSSLLASISRRSIGDVQAF